MCALSIHLDRLGLSDSSHILVRPCPHQTHVLLATRTGGKGTWFDGKEARIILAETEVRGSKGIVSENENKNENSSTTDLSMPPSLESYHASKIETEWCMD
jgi:hypothetical protein